MSLQEWKRPLGSDNSEATTRKRQLGSDNLEATTWKRQLVTLIGFRRPLVIACQLPIVFNAVNGPQRHISLRCEIDSGSEAAS